jgi:hypothetical protein
LLTRDWESLLKLDTIFLLFDKRQLLEPQVDIIFALGLAEIFQKVQMRHRPPSLKLEENMGVCSTLVLMQLCRHFRSLQYSSRQAWPHPKGQSRRRGVWNSSLSRTITL